MKKKSNYINSRTNMENGVMDKHILGLYLFWWLFFKLIFTWKYIKTIFIFNINILKQYEKIKKLIKNKEKNKKINFFLNIFIT
jgi:hypothetical protein